MTTASAARGKGDGAETHGTCGNHKLVLWPALLETTERTVRSIVGPHGQHPMDLGYFITAAREWGVRTCYAAYVAEPADEDDAALGDGLIMQFLAAGVVHIWAGAPLSALGELSGHPTPQQQEVIDKLAGKLADDPGYRALTRKRDREGYARTELPELAAAARGEHPVLSRNFVYRVLQAAHEHVEHQARHAYADVDPDALATDLYYDTEFAALADRTTRRAYVRQTLFDRFGYAPASTLVAQLLDQVDRR